MKRFKSVVLGMAIFSIAWGAFAATPEQPKAGLLDDQTPGLIRVGPLWINEGIGSKLHLSPGVRSLVCERQGVWRFRVDSNGALFQWLNEAARPRTVMEVEGACDRCAGEPSVTFSARDGTRLIVRAWQVLNAGVIMAHSSKNLGAGEHSASCVAFPDTAAMQSNFVEFESDSILLNSEGQATLRALAVAAHLVRIGRIQPTAPGSIQGEVSTGTEEMKLALGEGIARTAHQFLVRQGTRPSDWSVHSMPVPEGGASGVRVQTNLSSDDWRIEHANPPQPGRLDLCSDVTNWEPLRETICVQVGGSRGDSCTGAEYGVVSQGMKTEQCFRLSRGARIIATGAVIPRYSARLLKIPVLVRASETPTTTWHLYDQWPASPRH